MDMSRSSALNSKIAASRAPLARWVRRLSALLATATLGIAAPALAATSVDLSVSAYTWNPDPVVRGGTSVFSATVTNNDVATAADTLTLAIDLPTNVDFTGQTPPANCAFNLVPTPKTLTCTKATLAAQGTWSINFNGVGLTAGVQTTTATVSSATNTDPNTGNDSLIKNTTVISGADLSITKYGPGGCVTATPCNTTSGATINFTVRVANAGPDPATTFRVTDNLPAAVDFTYQSASGTGWSCSAAGTTLTCDYSGASIASGGSAPDITVTGRVITSAGTITNGASVASTDGTTGDPVAGNNGPSQVVVNVAAGTDLRANKTMVSSTTGMTTYAVGEAVTLTLSATNQGPQNATGVTITDTVSADFTIGTLPGGCAAVGQAITCTVGALNNGVTSTVFTIPLTVVGAAGNSGTNTANVARTGPAGGNNTPASVNYSIAAPFAHLTIAKTKSPNPVAAGQNITNTITVTNSNTSTSAATGTIRVTDALDPNETFVSFAGAGWSCSGVAVGATGTVTCDYAGANLARGASLPALSLITKADAAWLGTITNTACTGQSAGSPHTPADNSTTGNCQSRSVTGSTRNVDLSVAKVASIASPTHVLTSNNSVTYTLTVSNAGPDVAPTVNVSDPIPGWYNSSAGTTGGSAVITGQAAGESCSFGSNVTCTLLNLTNGAPRTITITLNRPFGDGSFTNTASVTSPDAIDTNAGNNSGSANIIVDPIADVAVTGIASAPNPVKVGVQLTYTTSIKNNGPSVAAGVVLRHTVDPARMSYVAGSASLTGGSGSCSYVSSFVGAPYAGQAGIECTGFTLANNEARQLTFKVIPVYPYPDALDATYTSNATITTTTVESDAPGYANNSAGNSVTVTTKAIDLTVTDNDPGYDPTAFGDSIIYQVKAQNNGPSQATGFKLTVTMTPPALSQPAPYTMVFNALGSTLPGGASCSVIGSDVVCYLGADQAHSIQAANSSATFNLKFDTGPISNVPPSSITYSTTAKVESYETGGSPFAGDTLPGNNAVTETTTVLPKTDLQIVSKAVDKPVVDLNETFTYTITVGNKGPSDASGVRVTDALPAGFVRTSGPIVVTPGAGVTLATNSCTGPAAGANGTVTCDIGPIPADLPGNTPAKQVTIAIPVRAAYQASGTYSFAFNTNVTNTASIAPLPNTSVDTTAGNNTNTVNVQVRKNSIAGYVYADNNLDDAMDGTGAEGLGSVTLTLTGTDAYGYTYGSGMNYAALTTTTSGTAGVNKGSFLFDKLPPGTWTIVETQPANYWDRFETAGSAGGTAPANTCDGTTNCASSAAANTISGISLPAATATAATGYIFQEYQRAQISGNVYSDVNNNGVKDAGETAISGATVTLSGTAYNGVNVCTLVTCATTTNASGAYSYANLPPSNGSGYTVTETQPGSYLNGKTAAGTVTGTNSVAGTATGANSDVIQAIKVYSNGVSINNNFGELSPATLSGYVFIDSLPINTPNAQRDAVNETAGIPGLTITLTGTDDLGNAINATATTAAGGAYSFANLRPGSYTVTETTLPSGLTHTGAQAGSKGGTIGGSARASGVGVTGVGNTAISAIALIAGDNSTGNNFGESGQGLSGYVYIDLNGNGTKDAGEPGIPGVSVTLSGTTIDNVTSVCSAINPNPCTLTTDANGFYSFMGLPASNGAGYILTEQSQAAAPLNNYADGTESLGTGLASPGSAGNDVFTGIVLPLGGVGANYNFGERAGSLAGTVYYDANDNGTKDGGEVGIAGVTLTLSGNTASGANVCTTLTALGRSCTVTTAADGSFSYTGLPASDATGYLLVETQPADYANRTDAIGTGCGTSCGTASVVGGNSRVSAIKLSAGAAASGFLFGEKTGSLSGFVYLDDNNNGTKDAGETGIAGVTVTLSGNTASGPAVCAGAACQATTAADGSYSFTGLKNADATGYTVTETQPGAYADGRESAGLQGGTVDNASFSANAAQNRISAIPFNAGSAATGYNFGEVQSGAISGRVYHDVNNNSQYEAGEALANVTLTLTGNDDLGNAVNVVVTTAADGSYSFTNLRPSGAGGYTVTETQPAGIGDYPTNTGTQVGTIGGSPVGSAGAGANAISGIVLPSGGAGINYNFREQASSLAGYVYLDSNDSGTMDAGEPGIAGVTVTLKKAGATVATTTTDAAGKYVFVGLAAGTYNIEETQPTVYLDGRETAGSLGGTVDNASFTNNVAQNAITGIVLPAGTNGTGYLFGERGGSLNGFVYEDANDNGIKDPGEAGIPGIDVTLSGTTSTGTDIATVRGCVATQANCRATTDATGAFAFVGVPPGTYKLVENQNQVDQIPNGSGGPKYGDGKETAGVAGGTVNNNYFGSQAAYNTIDNVAITTTVLSTNAGNVGGYLFGERLRAAGALTLKPPVVSGYVYVDASHTRTRGTAVPDPRVAGWTVTLTSLRSDGQKEIICSVTSDAVGYYHLDNLSCYQNFPQWANGLPTTGTAVAGLAGVTYQSFSLAFSNPGVNGVTTAPQSGGNAGTVDQAAGQIQAISLNPGDDIVEQNLPLDPSGVVYDALTRQPVGGALVTLYENGVAVPTACLTSAQNPVTTGTNGFYQFLILLGGGCPMAAGTHVVTIGVVPPAGYAPGVSTMIPPTAGSHVPPLGGVDPIQVQSTPPSGAQPTTYYLSFTLTVTGVAATSSSNVVNNHIPIDPVSPTMLLFTKTTPMINVTRGDLVPYTITGTNVSGAALANINAIDRIPPGFRYRSGSATLNGVPSEPVVTGRDLTWPNQTFTANEKKTWKLILIPGAGIAEGQYVNQAWSMNRLNGSTTSNVASAAVRVVPDPNFDCSDIVGKVFDDKNANGYQDEGEPGIANVRVATPRGLLVTSDADGRFHVACADVPQADHGSNFVMKLDERTLPSGYRVTTENPRDVRVTRGKMVKINFGATVHRVLRLDLNAAAFATDTTDLLPEWTKQLPGLIEQLASRPSVLRIAYTRGAEAADLAQQRIDVLTARIKELWRQDDGKKRPPIVVESEMEGAR
jgi:uncharacterized repeat protein (TIGR01451 family)